MTHDDKSHALLDDLDTLADLPIDGLASRRAVERAVAAAEALARARDRGPAFRSVGWWRRPRHSRRWVCSAFGLPPRGEPMASPSPRCNAMYHGLKPCNTVRPERSD